MSGRDSKSSRKKRKKENEEETTSNITVPISNSFGVLTNDDCESDMDDVDDESTEIQQPTEKTVKNPPIVITQNIADYSKCIKTIINSCTSKEVKIDYAPNKLTIHCSALVDYMALQEKLKEENMAHFTYTPKWLRSKHLVARRLPLLPIEELESDLAKKGIKCERITILKKHVSVPQPYKNPVYMMTFSKATDMKIVWNIDSICNVKVKWEKYKNSRKVTQCHNCQDFGHGTLFCQNVPRCVKCDKNHLTKQCDKNPAAPPKCVNCGGEHTANYSKCEKYLKHLEKVNSKRHSRTKQHNTKKGNQAFSLANEKFPPLRVRTNHIQPPSTQTSTLRTTETEWGQSRHREEKGTENLNSFQRLIEEIDKLNSLIDIGKMLRLVKTLNNKLSNCNDKVMQIQIILDVINGEY